MAKHDLHRDYAETIGNFLAALPRQARPTSREAKARIRGNTDALKLFFVI